MVTSSHWCPFLFWLHFRTSWGLCLREHVESPGPRSRPADLASRKRVLGSTPVTAVPQMSPQGSPGWNLPLVGLLVGSTRCPQVRPSALSPGSARCPQARPAVPRPGRLSPGLARCPQAWTALQQAAEGRQHCWTQAETSAHQKLLALSQASAFKNHSKSLSLHSFHHVPSQAQWFLALWPFS